MSADVSTRRSAGDGADWLPLFSAMRGVQSKLGAKAAEKLALITDQHHKSTARYFSRRRLPNGIAVFAIIRHPVAGVAFIEAATRDLPPATYREFWNRMAVAVGDALREKDAF